MSDNLCTCSFWSGRATLHHRREGCTPEIAVKRDVLVAELITAVNAAAQPLMTVLAESIGRIKRTLDTTMRSVPHEQHRR